MGNVTVLRERGKGREQIGERERERERQGELYMLMDQLAMSVVQWP